MNTKMMLILISLLLTGAPVWADDAPAAPAGGETFDQAAADVQNQLKDSLEELAKLRKRVADETIPLSNKLSAAEGELTKVRLDYQQTTRLLDSRTLDLSNLRTEIKSRHEESTYLSNLLSEYSRNFESGMHIAELQRYAAPIKEAKLAVENTALSEQDIFKVQAALLATSLDRIEDALGGSRFDGKAVDATGIVQHGKFALVGPVALFVSEDGTHVGSAEQRLGSLEPAVIPYAMPEDAAAAAAVVKNGKGQFPLDPSMGNAHKIEATHETIIEHIKKGGPVMVPIFALAGAALLVAIFKWLGLMLVRNPSRKRLKALLDTVAAHDKEAAVKAANAIPGPSGKMLQAGAEHLGEPSELIEEIMFERVMSTRLKLNRFLPFIAICASSAPLLGLLGTVTGIMNTFTLITVFGSGDVKTLSGGISEALITTEYGLIVAIPALLLHAFLSRKARGAIDQMEKSAVAFMNQIGKSHYGEMDKAA
ncbi:MAG: hypothetical protein GC162_07010 [Planctomycetes bacterium]|nr:hypothetical protein [Planctomycetota bacterium]